MRIAKNALVKEGAVFGKLTVRKFMYRNARGIKYWLCECECGNGKLTSSPCLTTGKATSCGCVRHKADKKGHTFGWWTVIERAPNPNLDRTKGYSYWLCRCQCGTERVLRADRLDTTYSSSCGCKRGEAQRLGAKEKALRFMEQTYRKSARDRNKDVAFLLSTEQFRDLIQQPCHYCGSEGHVYKQGAACIYTEEEMPTLNGLDRVDSDGDYSLDNVVPCCTTCNQMKLAMGRQEFLDHLRRILAHTS